MTAKTTQSTGLAGQTFASVDEYEAAILAGAAHWTAFLRVGPRERHTLEADSFADVILQGRALAAEQDRRVLIYGVSHEGRSVMVGSIWPNGRFDKAVRCDLPPI